MSLIGIGGCLWWDQHTEHLENVVSSCIYGTMQYPPMIKDGKLGHPLCIYIYIHYIIYIIIYIYIYVYLIIDGCLNYNSINGW